VAVRPTRRRLRWILGLTTLVITAWLAYGPFFAWLPVAPGFKILHAPAATVLFRDPPGFSLAPAQLTDALAELEGALAMRFTAPVRVVLCDEWTDFSRFTPWLRVSHGVGAITLPIGLVTYVTPLVRGRDDLLVFVKHEASHVLLYEQATLANRLTIESQSWLVEGIGVHFGNPHSYEALDEFRREASQQDLSAVIDPSAPGHRPGLGGFRFTYSAYGYFVKFLIDRFGSLRFQAFIAAYVKDPSSYRRLFVHAFGTTLDEALQEFRADLAK
jgi:hypothetical protein